MKKTMFSVLLAAGTIGAACFAAEKPLPDMTIANAMNGKASMCSFTFDDGTADHYTWAAPVLEKHGLKGTFMIIAARVGKPGCVTWDQVRDLEKRGHCIGNHTMTHKAIGVLYNEGKIGKRDKKTGKVISPPDPEKYKAFEEEVYGAQKVFEKELGHAPTILCFPYNNDASCKEVRDAFRDPVYDYRKGLDRTTTMEKLTAMIEDQIAKDRNFVMITHGTDPAVKAYATFLKKEDFETYVAKILEYSDRVHFGRYDENNVYAVRASRSWLKKEKDGKYTLELKEKSGRYDGPLDIRLRDGLEFSKILVDGKEAEIKTGVKNRKYFSAATGASIEIVKP